MPNLPPEEQDIESALSANIAQDQCSCKDSRIDPTAKDVGSLAVEVKQVFSPIGWQFERDMLLITYNTLRPCASPSFQGPEFCLTPPPPVSEAFFCAQHDLLSAGPVWQ